MEEPRDVFVFIAHTHWEGAVFKTREEYLDIGLPIILRALRLLALHPHYRFVLDQACYVQPFLERYPEAAPAFRQCVAEGRLQIVGGMDVMPDVNMPGGESTVRQILYGKAFFRRELGVDVTVGWQLDTFGHHAQMPQLMRLAGYGSFWSQRGVPDLSLPSEFIWEGLDGTRIPFYWLPHSYAITYHSPTDLDEFCRFMQQRYDALGPSSLGPGRVGPAGADVCLPEEHVPVLSELLNQRADLPFRLRLGLPSDYEAMVEARSVDRPVVRGELNPIFQGTYSSRIRLKQLTRELEGLLTTAEKLEVWLATLGETRAGVDLWRAWEPMLFNQTHDLMSGVMTDHVYADTLASYDLSARLARDAVAARLGQLAAHIDTGGEGVPLIVYNTLSWERTDVAWADAGFAATDVSQVRVVDATGQSVPCQVVEADRSDAGFLLRVKVAFVARQVPPMGYAVYRLVPVEGPAPGPSAPLAAPPDDDGWLENDLFRVRVDLATGAITDLRVHDGDWSALAAPGNVVCQEADHGDLWEPYRPLNGAQFVTMKERHPAPPPDRARWSTDEHGTGQVVARGPVFSEARVQHGFGDGGRFETQVRVYQGLPRVDIRTRVLNNERFVRYRVLFPTPFGAGPSVQEIPFGALSRPDGIEFPAQNWVDVSDGRRGLSVLNRGLPGNNVADGVALLSLLRCTEIVAYGHGGGYEGQGSGSGFELGVWQTYDYALVPHGGDWREAELTRRGLEFNQPLWVRSAAAHRGRLPAAASFLSVSNPQVVVSALKRSEDGRAFVVRLYESAGRSATGVRLALRDAVAADEADLLEQPLRAAVVCGGFLTVDFRPFEIKTFRLYGADWGGGDSAVAGAAG